MSVHLQNNTEHVHLQNYDWQPSYGSYVHIQHHMQEETPY